MACASSFEILRRATPTQDGGIRVQCFASALHVQRSLVAMLRLGVARATLPRNSASPRRCTCSGPSKERFGSGLDVQRNLETAFRLGERVREECETASTRRETLLRLDHPARMLTSR